MEVSGQLHIPAPGPPGIAPGIHLTGDSVGPRAGPDAVLPFLAYVPYFENVK
jgi:hypothetical protein